MIFLNYFNFEFCVCAKKRKLMFNQKTTTKNQPYNETILGLFFLLQQTSLSIFKKSTRYFLLLLLLLLLRNTRKL